MAELLTPLLFEPETPEGFQYRREFITRNEERQLLDAIDTVVFSEFEMRGVVARRRLAFFGQTYEGRATGPMPEFLLPLRERISAWVRVDPSAFAMALINEYRPGAPVGWHRDAPQYDVIAGVSLLSSCRMRFRPYIRKPTSTSVRRTATHEVLLEPRSGYVIEAEARSAYEHHVPPVTQLRYSITFRTLR